jgi:hypothetical protein
VSYIKQQWSSTWPTWLQRLLGTVPKSQVDKSCTAVLKNISEGLPILVLDHELQVATPLLILETQCIKQKWHQHQLVGIGTVIAHINNSGICCYAVEPHLVVYWSWDNCLQVNHHHHHPLTFSPEWTSIWRVHSSLSSHKHSSCILAAFFFIPPLNLISLSCP